MRGKSRSHEFVEVPINVLQGGFMQVLRRAAVVAALALPMAALPASAQRYHFDFGVNGGGSWYTPSLGGSDLGATSGGDVGFKPSWLVGTQFTWWSSPIHVGPRFGLRLNGTYNDGKLQQHVTSGTNPILFGDINMWSGSLDLMFGFKAPHETWSGMEVLPYLALGGGIKWTNPAGDTYTINDTGENKSWNGFPFTCFNGGCSGPSTILPPPGGINAGTSSTFTSRAGQKAYYFGEANSPMALLGLGADVRLAPSFALRLEVSDRLWKAPIVQANVPIAGYPLVTSTSSDKIVGKLVNEISLQAGLHMLFGLERVAVVAVAPPPPPPPAPAPAPPPAPEERSVSVCVIDPSGNTGIRTVDAIYMPSTGDTLVLSNGSRVALRNTIGTVTTASNAQWFVQGQPLTLAIGPSGKAQFTTYGSSRMINASDLTYLGTLNGVPVYADRDDVSAYNDQLMSARSSGTELTTILVNKALSTGLDKLKVVYVPLQPTGCVYQAMQRVEEVRKQR
jgi:hypothetical protein